MGSTFKFDGGKIEIIKGELGVPSLKLTARASENWDPKIWSPKFFGPASSPPVETFRRYNMLACYPYVHQQFHVHQLTPKKTLSNGLFLSNAAGFINHMTTNIKKYVLKKNIHWYMIYVYKHNQHKTAPWTPINEKKKTLHALTSQQKTQGTGSSHGVSKDTSATAFFFRRRRRLLWPPWCVSTAASWFPGAVAARENGCYPWVGTRPWLLNLCHGALWKGIWWFFQEIPTNHQKSGVYGVD